MTQTTLRAVTLKTVANYRHAAERAVGAYRAGGRRLIAVVQKGVDQAAQRGAEPYVPAFAAAMQRAGDTMGTLAVKSLEAVSAGTERAIEIGADGVTAQVKRVADLAGGVENRVVVSGLQAAVRFTLPGAQVALALSERVAAGADKLADVAAGPRSTRAKAAAQRARRAAPKLGKATGRSVVKAAREVAAQAEGSAQAVTRRAKAQVAKVSKVVAQVTQATQTKVAKAARKPAAKPVVKAAQAASKAAAKPARRAARKTAPVVKAVQEAVAAVTA